MIKLNDLAKFEILNSQGEWEPVLFCQLEPGDRFRKRNQDGVVMVDRGFSVYEVDRLPYIEVTPVDAAGNRWEENDG